MRFSALLLLSTSLFACEADGLIWMPPISTADALYRIIVKGQAGFIDGTGRIIIHPSLGVESNWGQAFYDGLLSLKVAEGPFLDTSGRKVLDNGFFRIWGFSEGLAPALKTRESKWGYIDHSGAFVIQPQFPFYPDGLVSEFSEGLAAVEVSGRLGYIDRGGKYVISPRFAAGTAFKNGSARVVAEGPCVYFDPEAFDPCMQTSARTAPSTGPKMSGPRSQVLTCKWRFVDRTGQQIGRADYDSALPFREGLAGIRIGGLWGFIDATAHIVISPRFHSVHSFSDGLALVEGEGISGFIDKAGNLKIPLRNSKADPFSDGFAAIGSVDEGYRYIDTNGKQAFEGRFVLASRFHHGIAHVKLTGGVYGGGTFAYINKAGKRVFVYEWDGRRN